MGQFSVCSATLRGDLHPCGSVLDETQHTPQLLERQTVQYALPRHAALSSLKNTPADHVQLVGRVCIRVDRHHASEFESSPMPAPVEVQTPWACVDLDGNAVSGTGLQDGVDIELVSRPTKQLAPSHVAQNCRVWIRDRPQDALRLDRFLEPELAVHARDDEVEPAEDVVGVVQRAVFPDVGFDALQDTENGRRKLGLAGRPLCAEPQRPEARGHRRSAHSENDR